MVHVRFRSGRAVTSLMRATTVPSCGGGGLFHVGAVGIGTEGAGHGRCRRQGWHAGPGSGSLLGLEGDHVHRGIQFDVPNGFRASCAASGSTPTSTIIVDGGRPHSRPLSTEDAGPPMIPKHRIFPLAKSCCRPRVPVRASQWLHSWACARRHTGPCRSQYGHRCPAAFPHVHDLESGDAFLGPAGWCSANLLDLTIPLLAFQQDAFTHRGGLPTRSAAARPWRSAGCGIRFGVALPMPASAGWTGRSPHREGGGICSMPRPVAAGAVGMKARVDMDVRTHAVWRVRNCSMSRAAGGGFDDLGAQGGFRR